MNIKTALKTTVATAALFAVAAPIVIFSPAEAGINNGNKNSLVVNGQIIRQIMFADDGNNSGMFLTDGTSTSSRVRWIASGQATESVQIGGIIELNIPQSNAAGTQSLGTANVAASAGGSGSLGTAAVTNGANTESEGTDGTWGIRLIDISFQHKTMGKLSIGQGNTASNGKSETSLAGVDSIIYSSVGGALGTGLSFWDSTNNVYTTKKIGSSFQGHDGLSRADRIRYDLPSFAGLSVATSYVAGGAWDVGASYSGKFGGIQVAAGAQYNSTGATSTTQDGTHSASLAVKHDSGLNAEVTWGKQRNDAGQPTFESQHLGIGLGYIGDFVNLGSTAMQVTWTEAEDAQARGDEATAWNIALAQNLSAVGSQLYLQFEHVSLDDATSTNYDDISMFMAGAKVTF